jgi:lysophospholipase
VAGTSSSLFNQGLAQRLKDKKYEELGFFAGDHNIGNDFVETAFKFIDTTRDDIASYNNPFYQWTDKENPTADMEKLQLVDGGGAEENIPLEPFLQEARNVDAIFAFDNSADTHNSWPQGHALRSTYDRAKKEADLYIGKVRMPPVPSRAGFVNAGLNTRPVFFGCDNKDVPTVIYIPNYSWSTASNTDTYKLSYSDKEVQDMIDNGRRSLDLNGSVPDWGRCLTCAM